MRFIRAKFVQAANYTPVARRTIRLIVLHSDEVLETSSNAEGVANFFHNQRPGDTVRGSSAHAVIDADSEVDCVKDHDVAWAAPGANHDGYHIEQAGYASQGRKQWKDPYSRRVIQRAAHRAAKKCIRYNIRPEFVTAAELRDGTTTGITLHYQVTQVLNGGQGHTDPGKGYPKPIFRDYLHAELRRTRRGRRLLRRFA